MWDLVKKGPRIWAKKGEVVEVVSNPLGAVSAHTEHGYLGLRPHEFQVVEWRYLRALSIRQPWAWLIANGYKDVENRNWPTQYRGRFLIHASKTMTRGDYEDCLLFLCDRMPDHKVMRVLPTYQQMLEARGGFVGYADLIDCVERSKSPWFVGEYGFVIANAKPLNLVYYPGELGFFKVYLEKEVAK